MCADRVRRHDLRCSRCHCFARYDGCARCDDLPRRLLMPPMAVIETRYCVHCGRPYQAAGGSPRLTCSNRCNNARWRAISKLAGTHAQVNGRFVRIKWQADE